MRYLQNELDLSGVGSIYRRVSDDAQDIGRQGGELTRFLDQHGVKVDERHRYEDLGWKRHQASERPAFNRLLKAVDECKVKWILVDRQDRFEAGDKFEFIATLHRIRKAGARLYTVDGREVTGKDIGSFLQTTLSSEQSEGELREKAVRVLTAKIEQAKRGRWQGGHVPYGMDVVCFSVPDMEEQWRVRIDGRDVRVKLNPDGSAKPYNGKANFPASEVHQVLQLRPSLDVNRVKVVRRIFATYATQSISLSGIAKQLNSEGVAAGYGAWENGNISQMLRNPVYIGRAAFNKHSQARYMQFVDGARKEVNKQQSRRNDATDWTLSDELFPPIIDSKTWAVVQAKLAEQDKSKRQRAPKVATLWLSRLLYCGGCGKPMRAFPRADGQHEYCCSTYSRSVERGTGATCLRNSVKHDVAEGYVAEYLQQTGEVLRNASATVHQKPPENLKRSLTNLTAAWARITERLRADGQVRLAYDDFVPENEIVDAYRQLFATDSPEADAELERLNKEHDQLTDRIINLPTTAKLAVAKVAARIGEIEARIADARARSADAAAEYEAAGREYEALATNWYAALSSLGDDASARERAEAVRKVISRVVLTFRPTGLRRPATEVARVEIVPVGAENDSKESANECLPIVPSATLF